MGDPQRKHACGRASLRQSGRRDQRQEAPSSQGLERGLAPSLLLPPRPPQPPPTVRETNPPYLLGSWLPSRKQTGGGLKVGEAGSCHPGKGLRPHLHSGVRACLLHAPPGQPGSLHRPPGGDAGPTGERARGAGPTLLQSCPGGVGGRQAGVVSWTVICPGLSPRGSGTTRRDQAD